MSARGNILYSLTLFCLWAGLLAGVAQAQTPVESVRPYPSLATAVSQGPLSSATSPNPNPLPMHSLLAPYLARSTEARQSQASVPANTGDSIPLDFAPWWESRISIPTQSSSLAVGVDDLLQAALAHSSNIRAISIEPNIRDSYLFEEGAAFDWRTFLETGYNDKNDPVGNLLTTGNNENRLKDRTWNANGGIRRTNEQGGELELAQRLGTQQNNTRFLSPNPQGTSRLELNYTHPLMNGAGRYYNRSRIVLAEIDSRRSRDEVTSLLQEHLLQVTEAYWDLYRARSRFLQRVTLYQAAEQVLEMLSGRGELDVLNRQVLRAKAEVAKRRSEIARAATQIENAESQLRVLVNDPALTQAAELTPLVSPLLARVQVSLADSLGTALVHQPEIAQAIRTLDATSVRLGVARNELLPKLDLLMSTYVAGLEGGTRSLAAWNNQFIDGRPGFSVGLLWEMPQGNRAARAREERRRFELQQAASQFEYTVETSLTVVEIAVREVDTSYQEMVGRYQTILAAAEETSYLSDRYTLLPGVNDSATLLLEDLLAAQERQADEEAAFVDSQINYSLSLVRLRKAMGTLLLTEPIRYQAIASPEPPQLPSWEELNLPTVPLGAANPTWTRPVSITALESDDPDVATAAPNGAPGSPALTTRSVEPHSVGSAASEGEREATTPYKNFPRLIPNRQN
jgi:outer membrane protein TolC